MDRDIGLRLELAAQPAHVDIDRPRIAVVVMSPHAVEQLPARVGTSGMRGEHRQELELLGPQVDQLTGATDLVGDQVDGRVLGHVQDGFVSRPGPVLEDRQAGGELAGLDRVRERLVDTGAERVEPFVDGLGGAQQDDAQRRTSPPFAQRRLDIAVPAGGQARIAIRGRAAVNRPAKMAGSRVVRRFGIEWSRPIWATGPPSARAIQIGRGSIDMPARLGAQR